MNTVETIPPTIKKPIFYSREEEILYSVLYLHANAGCTREEIQNIFSGNHSHVYQSLKRSITRKYVAVTSNRLGVKFYWITEKGKKYLMREKKVLEI